MKDQFRQKDVSDFLKYLCKCVGEYKSDNSGELSLVEIACVCTLLFENFLGNVLKLELDEEWAVATQDNKSRVIDEFFIMTKLAYDWKEKES